MNVRQLMMNKARTSLASVRVHMSFKGAGPIPWLDRSNVVIDQITYLSNRLPHSPHAYRFLSAGGMEDPSLLLGQTAGRKVLVCEDVAAKRELWSRDCTFNGAGMCEATPR